MRQTAPGLPYGAGSPAQAEDQSFPEASVKGVFRVWLVLIRQTVLHGRPFHSGRWTGRKYHCPEQSVSGAAASLHRPDLPEAAAQSAGTGKGLPVPVRYLSQRYTMPLKSVGGLLTDIGTEELAHMEIICAMVYQLTKNLTIEEAKTAGFDAYYIDHTTGIWPQAASALPFSAVEFQSKGDAVTDLTENLAAEQKARTVYDNLLRMIPEPEVREPLKFLRAREIVHFQRFGEALEKTKEKLEEKNYYYINPEFDKKMIKT